MAIVVERTSPKVDSTGAFGIAFFTGAPTVGNRIIVVAHGYSAGGEQTLTVTDDATGGSNSYSVDRHQYSGGTNSADIASAQLDRTKSGLGVTATYSGGFICFAAMEVSGLASTPVDVAVGAADPTSPFEVSTGTLAQADEIVVGALSFAAASLSTHGVALTTWGGLNPDTLYVNDGPTINSEYGAAGYKIVASTSSIPVGFSANNDGSGGSVVVAVTYKAAPALDPSSTGPFNVSDNGAGTASGTSSPFSPPANSWLYVSATFDTAVGASPSFTTPTNTGTALTWTLVGSRVNASGGAVAVWRAFNTGAQSNITVTVGATNTGVVTSGVHSRGWVDVWSGAKSDQTGAAVATGTSTTQNYSPSITASASGSRIAGVAVDWSASGAPTSSDIISAYHEPTLTSGGRALKAASVSAGSTTLNFVAGGASPIWTSVVYEILAEPAAAPPPQYARPSSDVSVGPWQPIPSSPATLYDKLDEAIADDADYGYATANGTGRFGLSSLQTPDAGTQTLRIRASGSPAKKLIARLMEGATPRATITVDPLTASVTQYTADASGITNYSGLALELEVGDATSPPSQTVTWGAAGTGASGTTSCAPSYPTGINAATSKLFCFVSGRSNTANTVPTMPSGWTRLVGFEGGTGTWGVDTGTRRCDLFVKDVVTGTESGTVTVSLAGTTANTLRATIFRVEVPSGYSLDIATGTGQDTTNDTSFSITSGTALSFQPGDMLLAGVGQNLDTGTGTSSLTASGITFGAVTRQVNVAVSNGNDHRSILAQTNVSSGSGTVAPTHSYTVSAAASGAGIFVRLRAVPPTEFARVTWAEFEVPAAASGGGGTTVSCATGSTNATGLAAAVHETVSAKVAAANATGLAAAVHETVSAKVAAANATGLAAAAHETVSAFLGNATAQGLLASLSVGEAVACLVGSAQASGVQAALFSDVSIQCQVAGAVASGVRALLVESIQASVGSASAQGLVAQISDIATLACSVGTASASGKNAGIGESVVCSVAQAAASGLVFAATSDATIHCGAGAASATGVRSSLHEVLVARTGAASTLGLQATVYADTLIIAGTGSATASGPTATRIGVDITIPCTAATGAASGQPFALNCSVVAKVGAANSIGLVTSLHEAVVFGVGAATAAGLTAVTAGKPTLTGERTLLVPGEKRAYNVPAEVRLFSVPGEQRKFLVTSERRTFMVQ